MDSCVLQNHTVGELKPKNIEFVKTVISVAHSEANILGPAWLPVLHTVSQVSLRSLLLFSAAIHQCYLFAVMLYSCAFSRLLSN